MDYADVSLIVELAAGSPLDRSPNKNWVENAGGLPKYIEDIAVEIEKSGKTVSQAISIAISRVKKWAAGGDDVKPDTRAKAAKAVAEWEKLKAKNAAKKVAATIPATADHVAYEVLSLAAESFNISKVSAAWDSAERTRRAAAQQARRLLRQTDPTAPYDYEDEDRYRHVRETWSDFLVVSSGYDATQRYWKVPYTVEQGGAVTFAPEQEVKVEYTATTSDIAGVSMSHRALTSTERLALTMASTDHQELGVAADHPEIVELARRVKTAAGAKLFGQPVGSVITADKLAAVRKTVGAAKVRQVSSLGSRGSAPKAPSAPKAGAPGTKRKFTGGPLDPKRYAKTSSDDKEMSPLGRRRRLGKGNTVDDEGYDVEGPKRKTARSSSVTGAARRGQINTDIQRDRNFHQSEARKAKQEGYDKPKDKNDPFSRTNSVRERDKHEKGVAKFRKAAAKEEAAGRTNVPRTRHGDTPPSYAARRRDAAFDKREYEARDRVAKMDDAQLKDFISKTWKKSDIDKYTQNNEIDRNVADDERRRRANTPEGKAKAAADAKQAEAKRETFIQKQEKIGKAKYEEVAARANDMDDAALAAAHEKARKRNTADRYTGSAEDWSRDQAEQIALADVMRSRNLKLSGQSAEQDRIDGLVALTRVLRG